MIILGVMVSQCKPHYSEACYNEVELDQWQVLTDRYLTEPSLHMSRDMSKLDFCLYENNGADQLRSNCKADQRLCFCYTTRPIPLLLISEISSFYPSSVAAQAGLWHSLSHRLSLDNWCV